MIRCNSSGQSCISPSMAFPSWTIASWTGARRRPPLRLAVRRSHATARRRLKSDRGLPLSDREIGPDAVDQAVGWGARREKTKIFSVAADQKDQTAMVDGAIGFIRLFGLGVIDLV